ncbi:MAG TPA: hypothetical protein VIQ51_11320, partial [Chryseosolibacter sp.]
MNQPVDRKCPGVFLILLISLVSFSCSLPSPIPESGAANWQKLGPGGGGSTFKPIFSSHNPDNFIVRCDMTGTYISRDGGESYSQVNFGNGSSAYTFDPVDSTTLYVGASALHRSDDGGHVWEQIFPAPSTIADTVYTGDHASFRLLTTEAFPYDGQGNINAIRVDPADRDVIYFSRNRFFYNTNDGGKTWSEQELELPVEYLYINNSGSENQVYIFTSALLYVYNKSSEELTKTALPREIVPAFSFTGGKVSGSEVMRFFALHNEVESHDEFGKTEVWISEDKGKTWKRTLNPVISNAQSGIKPSYSMIACAENDADHAYVVSNRYEEKKKEGGTVHWYGALKTSDGGKNWQWVMKGGGGSGQYGVKDGVGVENLSDAWAETAFGGEYIRLLEAGVYPQDGNVAVVTDWYRIMKTKDGGKTWREVYSVEQDDGSYASRGLDVTTAYGVHFDPFDSEHIAISYTDIGYHHSYNGGKSWFRSVEGVPTEWVNTNYWMAFDPKVKDKVWSVWSSLHDFPRGKMTRNPKWKQYAKGGVCVSTDGGRTWKPSNAGMGDDSPSTSIVLDPNSAPGSRTLYASVFNKGVFKSTDDGKTWMLKNKGLEENTAAFELTIQQNGNLFLTVSPTPMHKNGNAGTGFYSGAVYRSTDGAESWTKLKVSDGLLFPNGVAFDPKNQDRIYLACWADITLSDLVGGNVVRENNEENRTLEMPGGIFLSEDGGETWKSIFDQ